MLEGMSQLANYSDAVVAAGQVGVALVEAALVAAVQLIVASTCCCSAVPFSGILVYCSTMYCCTACWRTGELVYWWAAC